MNSQGSLVKKNTNAQRVHMRRRLWSRDFCKVLSPFSLAKNNLHNYRLLRDYSSFLPPLVLGDLPAEARN